jgi:hypothetical protein
MIYENPVWYENLIDFFKKLKVDEMEGFNLDQQK